MSIPSCPPSGAWEIPFKKPDAKFTYSNFLLIYSSHYQQGSEAKLIAVCDLDSVRRWGFSLDIREGKSIRFLSKPNLLVEEEEGGKTTVLLEQWQPAWYPHGEKG